MYELGKWIGFFLMWFMLVFEVFVYLVGSWVFWLICEKDDIFVDKFWKVGGCKVVFVVLWLLSNLFFIIGGNLIWLFKLNGGRDLW